MLFNYWKSYDKLGFENSDNLLYKKYKITRGAEFGIGY